MDIKKDLILVQETEFLNAWFSTRLIQDGDTNFIKEVPIEEVNECGLYTDQKEVKTDIDDPYTIAVMDFEDGEINQFIEITKDCTLYYEDTYGGITHIKTKDDKYYRCYIYTPMETHSSDMHPEFFDEFDDTMQKEIKETYKSLVKNFNEVNF